MLYSLLTNSGVEVIGGLLFFVSAIFLIKDKLLCEQASMGKRNVVINWNCRRNFKWPLLEEGHTKFTTVPIKPWSVRK